MTKNFHKTWKYESLNWKEPPHIWYDEILYHAVKDIAS